MDWNRVQNQSSQGNSFTGGVVQGAWQGAKALASDVADLGKAGYKVATDAAYRDEAMAKASKIAQATKQFGAQAAREPIGTGASVWNQAKAAAGQARQAFVEARDAAAREGRLNNFYGNVVGRGGFEVGSVLVPVSKLGLIGKGVKGASAVAKTTTVARKVPQAQRLGKSAGKLKNGAKTKLGHAQDCKAAAAAAAVPKKINLQEFADWYRKQGDYFANPKNLDNHLQGTDFRKPVMKRTLPAGTELIQYVRADGKPGMYFARPGTPLSQLGICEPPPRVMRKFVVNKPIEIVESTTSALPQHGLAAGVGGTGGGQQLIFPKGWEKSVAATGRGK